MGGRTLFQGSAFAYLLVFSDEIREIVENERKSQAELKEVQRELGISKRAFVSIETEFVALKKEKEELEKLRDDLLNQLKVRLNNSRLAHADVEMFLAVSHCRLDRRRRGYFQC